MQKRSFLIALVAFFGVLNLSFGQTTIRGEVFDDLTGDPLIGANVIIEGTYTGTQTDFDGQYTLKTDLPLPITLTISFTGYAAVTIEVTDPSVFQRTRMGETSILIEAVQITGSRILDKQKESPLTVESLDLLAIRTTPSSNFYDGLGSMKDVDLTAASLGFKIINTRGFNSTSPVRSLQIIDGVDNQAPGLNFSLGNFLGCSELDVLKVDIVVGASSAYYGPNAFNGVISMETKNPFIHKGLSGLVRVGQRNLFEGAIRYADAFKNRSGDDVLAYKLNFFALRADDWEAENYSPITDSRVSADNPGRYDAVNIYGDGYNALMDLTTGSNHLISDPGLGTFYRIGYREIELVDYNTRNYKANAAFHLRTSPANGIESPELILSSNFGSGTTVYQGDNRFSLRDILFFQNRIEFRQRDRFFIRAYATHEDAGSSYDPYFTALRLQDRSKNDTDWATDYRRYWKGVANYPNKMRGLGYPVPITFYDTASMTFKTMFDENAALQWLVDYADSLSIWHALAAGYANSKNIHIEDDIVDFYAPGTPEFEAAFNDITNRLNNEEGGTRFYDKSALYHVHGEYAFTPHFISEIRIGGNYRLYLPKSKGTIFNDSIADIRNSEIGFYVGVQEKFSDNKLIASATLRMDKNENLDWIATPAASLVYKPAQNTYLRASFSSALRNPTLTDQYLDLNVGPATLAGHIGRVDSLITIESFRDGLKTLNWSNLDYFSLDPIRPEQVTTFELGVRTSLFKSVYVDLGYYRNTYQHFLGYLLGISADFDLNSPPPVFPENVTVYRYSANSRTKVNTQGFSAGINYYLNDHLTLNGNYSYNELTKSDPDDPIIPAYNTPTNKFNVGLTGHNIQLLNVPALEKVGFGINYKWVEGFLFEGSPQFTGFVPTYDLLDAQVSVGLDQLNTTIKVGGSNILNNNHFETYGGPYIGSLAYISLLYEFKKD
jgi:outer membrane receptor protein involved in Fe transport